MIWNGGVWISPLVVQSGRSRARQGLSCVKTSATSDRSANVGAGYPVATLVSTLEEILGLSRSWRLALAGVGRIGTALLGYGLEARGFDPVAAFDVDSNKVGARVYGLRIEPVSAMTEIIRERDVQIGVIATPADVAREIADQLAGAGVGAILNFAPVELGDMNGVPVRTVDIALELEGLSYILASVDRHRAAAVNSDSSSLSGLR